MRVVAAVAVATLMAMAGCSGDGDDGDEDGTSSGAGTSPESSSSTPAPSATTAAGATAGKAACVDPSGDVTTGPSTDLVSVVLDRKASGVLTVIYELAGDAASGPTSWTLAVDQGVTPLVSLVIKAPGSQPPSSYAFDFRTGRTTGLNSAPTLSGNRVTADFPVSLDPVLAKEFHWLAVSNDGTADVDRCEGGFPQI